MSRTQTICVNSTPGDATASAKVVAESIRATGKVVTIGTEYTQPYGHKAGMLAVDLTIDDAPVVNVQDLGAKGDGVTDDSKAFRAAGVDPQELVTALTERVPFNDGPDLSQGPDATDEDGNITDYRRQKREKKARNQ